MGVYINKTAGMTGKGVFMDFNETQKAAEQGDAEAQFNLGESYVEKDPSQAFCWWHKAAVQGHAAAQYNLGLCYAKGTGVEMDDSQAVYWIQRAADQGDAGAQNGLGQCYIHGTGVEQDDAQAVYWYRKAADQGHAEAQYNLAICYGQGTGVEQDDSQAACWCQKAADQGHAEAAETIAQLKASKKSGGCYIATAVYGSYNCPQVWMLRRYRDNSLARTGRGRALIRAYYAISPSLVKWFGNMGWFQRIWKRPLDAFVVRLQAGGVENTPYIDRSR
jgi:TPR repeat protein